MPPSGSAPAPSWDFDRLRAEAPRDRPCRPAGTGPFGVRLARRDTFSRMDRSTVSLSMDCAAALMAAAGLTPAQGEQLLSELGLPCHPAARLSEQEFAMLYRTLAVTLDDEMLHLLSRPLRPGTLKYTGLALLDAKTVGAALHRWSWMYRVLQDDLTIGLTVADGVARVDVAVAAGALPTRPFAVELLLKMTQGMASWLAGQPLPLQRVDLPITRPPYAADHTALYPGPVYYDQPHAAIAMDAALLDLPVRRTRPQLDDFLLRAPEDWLFARARKTARLSLRLRDHLAQHLPRTVTAEGAADALAVSLRTLHRHLADEGTSFQRVKDEFRRDRAMQMLAKTAVPIATISEQLGFDSVASFHRAFRGWTGHTPGGFRSGGGGPV